ncbi:PspC domain-containing protein [Aliikangiella maris]|uniref:PspC domain-containing protein n=2 Tax=Aliikangiella maris TaxID=3162458 RepID=A0ABV3MPA3_9GAMM
MNKYTHYRRDYSYREKPVARSKIMGVCAGIAHQMDWDVTGVRVVAVIGLFAFTVPTVLAYIVAGALFY